LGTRKVLTCTQEIITLMQIQNLKTMAKKPKKPIPIYQLKIVLCDSAPPIFRILRIKGNAPLGKLHDYIQGVMGWKDCHLHEFSIKGRKYRSQNQMYEEIDAPDMFDERNYRLNKLLKEGDRFKYEYDFGDSWEHEIAVEKILPHEEDVHYPVCIYGQRACPPEDCGGTSGYEELLEVLQDTEHEDYEQYSQWAGDDFDPEHFDLAETNDVLDNIKSNLREPKGNWI
jgi:hypothetical protein